MSEAETVAVLAEAETERQEQSSETAVELATIQAGVEETRVGGEVAIAEAQADAAVEVAEAMSEGTEWRTEVAELRGQLQGAQLSLATMAESMALLATANASPSIPISPLATPEPEPPLTETEEAEAEEILESAEAAGPSESPADQAATNEARARVRRLM